MSQSETSAPALGSREDFWGDDPGPDEQERGHSEYDGVSFEEWVAGKLLRKHPEAELLCPTCLYEDRVAVELTEPQHYVEESEVERESDDEDDPETWTELRYSDHRRHRWCGRCSQLCWGGKLADLPEEDFRDVVVEFFGRFQDLIPSSRQEELLENVMERKSNGMDDEDNLEALFLELEFDDLPEEYHVEDDDEH